MTREAFDLSERFRIPVLVRLVTRLAHSRAVVQVGEARPENETAQGAGSRASWILLPGNARRPVARPARPGRPNSRSGRTPAGGTRLELNASRRRPRRHHDRHRAQLLRREPRGSRLAPSHLHVGAYPLPVALVRQLAAHVGRLLVLEEGYPFLERQLRGLLPPALPIAGKESGELPPDGELTPDLVRQALGLPIAGRQPSPTARRCRTARRSSAPGARTATRSTPSSRRSPSSPAPRRSSPRTSAATRSGRCRPTARSNRASAWARRSAWPRAPRTRGCRPAVAVIGDSTFLHSGVTPLMDAIAANTDMTLIILDNETTAMTGGSRPSSPPRACNRSSSASAWTPSTCT